MNIEPKIGMRVITLASNDVLEVRGRAGETGAIQSRRYGGPLYYVRFKRMNNILSFFKADYAWQGLWGMLLYPREFKILPVLDKNKLGNFPHK